MLFTKILKFMSTFALYCSPPSILILPHFALVTRCVQMETMSPLHQWVAKAGRDMEEMTNLTLVKEKRSCHLFWQWSKQICKWTVSELRLFFFFFSWIHQHCSADGTSVPLFCQSYVFCLGTQNVSPIVADKYCESFMVLEVYSETVT